ncbi:MAG: nucleotide sugar synthetase-like protein [Streptococcus pyogenes]|nr:MAG: nucleotide sugar synthetase-like protein [Streptococcus pyogenes]
MKVHITNLHGMAAQSTAQMAQNKVAKIARDLGFYEIGVYFFDTKSDSPSELARRMDGMIASVSQGDVLIAQFPTWNSVEYDDALMTRLSFYGNKVIIFVHDIIPLMFASNRYLLPKVIATLNRAALLILPSQAMYDLLIAEGLTVQHYLIQELWDYETDIPVQPATYQKLIHFPGNPSRFPFLLDWHDEVKLQLYSNEVISENASLKRFDWRPTQQLIMEMAQGGFGLIWHRDDDLEYMSLYCPYKLAIFIAAGIPVIARRGIANQAELEKKGVIIVVDTLEEAADTIKHMSPEVYNSYCQNVKKVAKVTRHGWITRQLLTKAVYTVINE